MTLLGHDLTRSIALGVVARRPEWFRAVVVLPSFAWPVEDYPHIYHFIQLVGSPFFRFLSYTFNFFLEYTLRTITRSSVVGGSSMALEQVRSRWDVAACIKKGRGSCQVKGFDVDNLEASL